ncbi:MAG: PAS and ANTAR domain-containing protein [Actinobacteria bacterium]|nr:PAS and ANTAR domain-containing protein [Actinomycetota bacterium]
MSDALADAAGAASEHWEVAAVLAGGDTPTVGGFRFFVNEQRWVWSDEVARMHGYAPGKVEPTPELLLSHKHPDDRARVAEILERVRSGGLFSGRHRIIDTSGKTHWMVVVGDHMVDGSGVVIGTQGYYVDVTDGMQADLTSEVKQVVKSRAVIEQAKGVLMAVLVL